MDQGHTSVHGTVTKLTLIAEGATVSEPNVLPAEGIEIPDTPLVRDQKLVIPLPASGTLDVPPFVPTATTKSIVLGLGSPEAKLGFDGEPATDVATCGHPSPDALLVDAPVTG